MKITSNKHNHRHPIFAADEDTDRFDDVDFEDPEVADTIDDMADDIEDMKDSFDEVEEDSVQIEVENNIEGHYIAECELCHGIFISAVIESDQDVSTVTGVCPLCGKESDQSLNWVVKKR